MKRTAILFFLISIALLVPAQKRQYRFLIGTYTNTGKSEGIYSYTVDAKIWTFLREDLVTGVQNPSYLAFSPDHKFVYAVRESDEGGAALAYSFDTGSGKFRFINSSPTQSAGPCYVLSTDKHVFTANYGGGSISVFGRNTDGSLTSALQVIAHVGKSIDAGRQNEPHVHQVILSPDGKYVVVNDLGTDEVTVYRYNPVATKPGGILTPYDTLRVKPGSGPRHATFSRNGKMLFLLQELDATVSTIKINKGKLKLLHETTLDNKQGTINGAADIHLSPDGRFLYATNRGNANDMTCFSVVKDGRLTLVQQLPTGGKMPRNFAITPDGKYVFAGHQQTDNIVVFERDTKTGKLTNTGKELKIGSPVCILFY